LFFGSSGLFRREGQEGPWEGGPYKRALSPLDKLSTPRSCGKQYIVLYYTRINLCKHGLPQIISCSGRASGLVGADRKKQFLVRADTATQRSLQVLTDSASPLPRLTLASTIFEPGRGKPQLLGDKVRFKAIRVGTRA
jgi:hypothetical protein